MKAVVVVGFACLLKLRSGFFGVFGGSAAVFDGFWCFLLGDGFLGDFLGDERPPGSLFKSMQADKVLGST